MPFGRPRPMRLTTFRRMVSSPHEAMHQIFREDPRLFARALPKAGITLPEPTEVQLLDTDLTEIRPLERRVDTLLRVDTADNGSYLLAIEMQGDGTRTSSTAGRTTWHTSTPSTSCRRSSLSSARTSPPRPGRPSPSVSAPPPTPASPSSPWSWGPTTFPRSSTRTRRRRTSVSPSSRHSPTPRTRPCLRYWTHWRRHSSTPAARSRRTGRNSSRSVWVTPGRAHSGGT